MAEFSYEVKIPKERVAVLIGIKGETKKQIEQATKVKMDIDSEEGDVVITGDDGLALFSAREVIKAIGRGFNPEICLKLLNPDYSFEILDIGEYTKSKKSLIRLKGRVIGQDGKTRRIIEEITEAHLSVYGKTISIIGTSERVAVARQAVENLLRGSPHKAVYQWLERQRRKIKAGLLEPEFDMRE